MLEAALVGRLTADIDVRTSGSGKRFASVTVAVGTNDATQWVRLALFGEKADQAAAELRRDDLVYVEGRLKLEHWTGRDGAERTGLAITVARIEAATIGRRKPAKARKARTAPDKVDATSTTNTSGKAFHDDPIPF